MNYKKSEAHFRRALDSSKIQYPEFRIKNNPRITYYRVDEFRTNLVSFEGVPDEFSLI